jgi:tetratricopeptide (TPR) repeat protein
MNRTAAPPHANKQIFAVAALLFLLTGLVYAGTLKNAFINYDDPAYVTKNLHVQQGLSAANFRWAFAATSEANWHPLTWLSHMADVSLFGGNAAGHHLTNVLFHALNATLLFCLLYRGTGFLGRSAWVAALFAVHPLNVETVAWVAERKSVLSTFFFLLAIGAYGLYVRKPSLLRYAGVFLLFALGLMAKPMIITLPLALLLLDYWPLERIPVPSRGNPRVEFFRSLAWRCAEKIPLLLLSIASAVVTVVAQHRGGAVGTKFALPLSFRVSNAIYSYSQYLIKALFPSRLAIFYPHPEGHLAIALPLLSGVFLVAGTIFVCRLREVRYLPVGWFWYLGTMFPVIGILQVGRQALADRYAYIPLLGIFVIVVWSAAEGAARLAISTRFLGAVASALVLAYSSVTLLQISYWKNSFALFQHTLAVTQNNSIAELNFGESLVERGQPELAEIHFLKAAQFAPELGLPHYDLGTLLQNQGRLAEAMVEYQLALPRLSDPLELAQLHNNRGAIFLEGHQYPQAMAEFDTAIQLHPEEANSFLGKGMIFFQTGEYQAAQAVFQRAIEIAPSSPVAWFWFGRACEAQSKNTDAIRAYQITLRIAPAFPGAQARLSELSRDPRQ